MADGVPMNWFVLIALIIVYAIAGFAINLAENASYVAEEGVFGTLGPGAYNNFTSMPKSSKALATSLFSDSSLIHPLALFNATK